MRWDRMALHSTLQEVRSSLWLEDLYTDVNKGGGLGSVGKEKMWDRAAEISSPVPPGPVPNHELGATKVFDFLASPTGFEPVLPP